MAVSFDGARVVDVMSALRVLIDGRSGSGKTSLARFAAEYLGAELVSLDDFYPGWDGLAAGARMVCSEVLQCSRYTRWCWRDGVPGSVRYLRADLPWVVEGCGVLSDCSVEAASLTVWVEAPEVLRRERALARDGQVFAEFWEMWARQESQVLRPELAELMLVNGVAGFAECRRGLRAALDSLVLGGGCADVCGGGGG